MGGVCGRITSLHPTSPLVKLDAVQWHSNTNTALSSLSKDAEPQHVNAVHVEASGSMHDHPLVEPIRNNHREPENDVDKETTMNLGAV